MEGGWVESDQAAAAVRGLPPVSSEERFFRIPHARCLHWGTPPLALMENVLGEQSKAKPCHSEQDNHLI